MEMNYMAFQVQPVPSNHNHTYNATLNTGQYYLALKCHYVRI